MMRRVYLLLTQDRFELPLEVADSIEELASLTGARPESIRAALCHQKFRTQKRPRKYAAVWIDEKEDDKVYRCYACGVRFDVPAVRWERNGDGEHSWTERHEVCPICGYGIFEEIPDEDEADV